MEDSSSRADLGRVGRNQENREICFCSQHCERGKHNGDCRFRRIWIVIFARTAEEQIVLEENFGIANAE